MIKVPIIKLPKEERYFFIKVAIHLIKIKY
jgi:hypothetical protein